MFCVVLSLLLLSGFAHGESNAYSGSKPRPQIRFYSEISTPFFWLDKNSEPQGINVDIANALIEELQLQATIEQLPWARAFKETNTRPNGVLLSLLRSPTRENQFQWLGLVHVVEAALVGLSENRTFHLNELDDAKALRVGTIRGYGSADYLRNKGFVEGSNLVLVSDTGRLWQMLFEQRIDLVVSTPATLKYELQSIGLDPNAIEEKLKLPALNLELQVATGKLTSESVVQELRTAFSKLEKRSDVSRILKKWGIE